MRWPAALLVGFSLLAGASGCARRSCDLVEAELRSRDQELREIRDELFRAQAFGQALERELRHQRCPSQATSLPTPQTFSVRSIRLARQTGGYDDDDVPGDEGLQVVLEPVDGDGHSVKVPGTLHVSALEISEEGTKKPLASWTVPAGRLHEKWRSGLLSTGYYVQLPWKAWPSAERVRVVAQLTLNDGRLLEADRDVSIRLTTPERRPVLPPLNDGPPPEQLPPPRTLDTGGSGPFLPEPVIVVPPEVTWWSSNSAPQGIELMRPIPMKLR